MKDCPCFTALGAANTSAQQPGLGAAVHPLFSANPEQSGMYLYIMSRPHSGSTILDILLGNADDVESVGQLISDIGKLGNLCACGAEIGDCPFWTAVRERLASLDIDWNEAAISSMRQGHVRNFLRTWAAGPRAADCRRLAVITEALETAILAQNAKKVLLDSSKEPTRGLFLLKYVPSARIIRLVRNPLGSVASHYWRIEKQGRFHFLRREYRRPALAPLFLILAAGSWMVGNLLAEIAVRAAPDRVIRIRYEDLRDDPRRELSRLGEALGIDVRRSIKMLEGGQRFSAGHNIGGNAIRLDQQLRFDPQREAQRQRLPRWLELVTLGLCWPLMLAYGYPLRRSRPRPAVDANASAGGESS